MFLKRTREGEMLPRGRRIAYWDVRRNQAVSAPIGIHWIVRVIYLAWARSHRWRPSKWENALRDAYAEGKHRGFKEGFAQGVVVTEGQLNPKIDIAEDSMRKVGALLGLKGSLEKAGPEL